MIKCTHSSTAELRFPTNSLVDSVTGAAVGRTEGLVEDSAAVEGLVR
jgi:hypothetical protein